MAIGTLFGGGSESSGLYGIATGSAVNPTVVNKTYFEWFIFTTSAGAPATPTGGSWNFTSNIGTAPAGWFNYISGVPLNSLWFSIAFVDSRNPLVINWSTPGLISSQSVYATAYADVFTGNGSTVAWTLSNDPVVVNNTDVSINGVTQVPTTDYTISGTTLTTSTAAPLNAIILVKYRQALPLSYYGAASNVQFTPYGWIAATNVQDAFEEVVDDLGASSGSSLVGFLQSGTGAVPTTVQAKLRESVSVLDFGAVGDGSTDDTVAIQTALTQSAGKCVYFPPRTFNISNKLFVSSNTTIIGYSATLFCTAASNAETGLYITDTTYLVGVNSVSVYGLKINGNRANRTPPGTGALFYISSGENHTLVDCVALNSTIDGFQVAGSLAFAGGVNKNTRFYNCEADNSYRNGLSLVGTDNFADYGGKYHDTNGVSPQIGVDIEPDGINSRNFGFAFYGTHVYNNVSHGISVNSSTGTTTTGLISSVVASANGGYGFQCDQPSTYVRISAPQSNGNTLGAFDTTTYAFDQDNLAQRTIFSARVRKSTSQTVTSATFVDVTGTTVSFTPTYANSGARLRVKGSYSLTNSSGTVVSASIQLINVATSSVIDSSLLIIQVNNNGANILRQDGTFFLSGQENFASVAPVSYKLQAKLNSGTQVDITLVEVVAEEINFG